MKWQKDGELGQEAEISRSTGTGLSTVSVPEYAKENAGDFDSPESIFGVGIWGRYMKMWFPS